MSVCVCLSVLFSIFQKFKSFKFSKNSKKKFFFFKKFKICSILKNSFISKTVTDRAKRTEFGNQIGLSHKICHFKKIQNLVNFPEIF